MPFIRLFVRNPVMANLLMSAVIVLGVLSFVGLPRELMSNISFNWVFLTTTYPGVSSEEMEKLVTIPIEEEIQDVRGIDSVSSQSTEGISFVSIKFKDMDDDEFRIRFQELKDEVDKAQLPDDVDDTVVMNLTTDDMMPVISVHLHGKIPEKRLVELAKELRSKLLNVSRISKVELQGTRDREVWVELDPIRLEGFGLTLAEVRDAIRASGTNVPGGNIDVGREELLLRTIGEFKEAAEVGNVIIRSTADGKTIRVSDVGKVKETFEDSRTISRLDLDPVVSMTVTKQPDGNSIDITDEVKVVGKAFETRYAGLVKVSYTQDTSEQIHDVMSKLSNNAWAGFIVVIIVMFLMLGLRNAVLAAAGIPISFFACFIFMHRTGGSFDGNSLFALVLVLGIIVDDAIIIVENCFRHVQLGKTWHDAAVEGTAEVAAPVIAATATTIAAFLPLALLPGIMGKFMKVVPIVVSLALVASLIEAFVILPSHFADWPGKRKTRTTERTWIVGLRELYGNALAVVVKGRYFFAVVMPVVLLGAAGFIIQHVGVNMFAGEEIAMFQVRMKMPTGTNLDATSIVLEQLERAALDLPKGEVRAVHATAGLIMTDDNWVFRSNVGQIWVDLYPSYERKRSADQIMDDLRGRLDNIPGPSSVELAKINTGPPVGKPVEVKIKGKYLPVLEEVAEKLKVELRKQEGVVDIGDDLNQGKREIRFAVDPERAALYGMSILSVGTAIQQAVNGTTADKMYDGDEEIEVVVRVDKGAFKKPEDFLRLPITTPSGAVIPLDNIAGYIVEPTIDEIKRYKNERAVTVFASVDEKKTTSIAVNDKIMKEFAPLVEKQYSGVSLDFSGEFKEFKDSFVGLVQLFVFGLLLMYTILATQFRSYAQPFVILLTIPFAFAGAGLGLFISGNPFSIITLYGIVALAGVAVNDAIVLVSFTNNLRKDGVPIKEAVVQAAKLRLRAIILTSVTTIAGLVPMAMGLGGMSLSWAPLANTIVWGLAVGTFLTIFLIPAAYVVLENDIAAIPRWLRTRWRGEKASSDPV